MGRTPTVTQDPPVEGAPALQDPPVEGDAPVEGTPTPDEGAPTRTSRRAQADVALASSASASKPLVLAQGCAWHEVVQAGVVVGKSGITVETSDSGPVREYLTWVPRIGRVQKVPTYGVFPAVDAGDLE